MEQRLTIVTLGVSDLGRAADFYTNKFGWKPMASSNDDIKFFQLNGMLLSLYPVDKLAEDAQVSLPVSQGFRPFTIAHNARSEAEVDQLIDELRRKGVEIIKEPQKVFWGGYSSYVTDPDGNLWEIAFNPFLPMDEQGNVSETK